ELIPGFIPGTEITRYSRRTGLHTENVARGQEIFTQFLHGANTLPQTSSPSALAVAEATLEQFAPLTGGNINAPTGLLPFLENSTTRQLYSAELATRLNQAVHRNNRIPQRLNLTTMQETWHLATVQSRNLLIAARNLLIHPEEDVTELRAMGIYRSF
ncbi:MAG: hypothetical protein ACREGI_01210, partial [Candidatus Levyibacteriota bacterium]